MWRSVIQLTFHWDLPAVAAAVDCRGEGKSRRPVRGPEPETSGRGRWGGVARCWAYGSFPMELMDWMWRKKVSEISKMTFKDWGLTVPLRGPFWFPHSEPWHHIFCFIITVCLLFLTSDTFGNLMRIMDSLPEKYPYAFNQMGIPRAPSRSSPVLGTPGQCVFA